MASAAPPPVPLLFFLRHDLRLAWRDFRGTFGGLGTRALGGLTLTFVLIMHAAVWSIAVDVGALSGDPATRDAADAAALPMAGFILMLMLAQTLNGATKLLYARGDLDLVLSSPVSVRKVVAVRAVAVAIGAFASAAIFVLPLADAGALLGHLGMLGLYPTLAGGALLATALGLCIALALFRTLGPRHTRLAAQVLATFIGATFVLALQLHRFLPALLPAETAPPAWLRGALLVPVRAAMGDPSSLGLWLLASVLAFAAAALTLGPAFADAANAAVGAGAGGPRGVFARGGRGAARRPKAMMARAFGRGPAAGLRRKEWRVIARDPWVVSQVLLQILYMVPMIALLWSGSRDPALAVAPMIAVVTFQVASSLTWLSLSGEDAPDLLASAPVPARALRRAKLEAVGLLTLGIVGTPLVYLVWVSPAAALSTAAIGGLGLGTAVALQSWHGKPGRRTAFAARHRESKLMALVEMALSMLFGLAAALAVLGTAWALAPLGLLGGVVAWLKPRGRRAAAAR